MAKFGLQYKNSMKFLLLTCLSVAIYKLIENSAQGSTNVYLEILEPDIVEKKILRSPNTDLKQEDFQEDRATDFLLCENMGSNPDKTTRMELKYPCSLFSGVKWREGN